jgi:uncharacterized alkaline shock family protein YloU
MSTGKKFILFILDLLLLTFVVPAAWDYYQSLDFHSGVNDSSQLFYVGQYMPAYLFWGYTVLSILLVLALIIILFYPRTYLELNLSEKGGTLIVKRSAIEGLVREKVIEYDYLKFPNIDVTLHKHKIEIDVKGEIIPRVEVTQKAQLLEQEIVEALQNYFGLEQKIKIDIEVNNVSRKTSSKSIRVA